MPNRQYYKIMRTKNKTKFGPLLPNIPPTDRRAAYCITTNQISKYECLNGFLPHNMPGRLSRSLDSNLGSATPSLQSAGHFSAGSLRAPLLPRCFRVPLPVPECSFPQLPPRRHQDDDLLIRLPEQESLKNYCH